MKSPAVTITADRRTAMMPTATRDVASNTCKTNDFYRRNKSIAEVLTLNLEYDFRNINFSHTSVVEHTGAYVPVVFLF